MSFLGRIKGTANELIESVSNALKISLHDGNGNKLTSFNGALDVHDADVHTIPFNEYFHRHTGTITTLAVNSAIGATSITVASSTGIVVGNRLQIQNGVIETTFPKVTVVTGNVLTLDRPLDYAFSIGDTVEIVSVNMRNVVGTLTAPISYMLKPNGNQTVHMVGYIFSMTHSTAGDLGLFGNLTKLSNGVTFRRYDGASGTYKTFAHWNSNADIKDDMYDLEFDTRSGGGGAYGTSGRGSIKIRTGAVPKLDGSAGDYMEILIQDDITGLIRFTLKGQGHIEGL